jgi:release factor glutamine methyltransferase
LPALRTAQDNARALGIDGLQWRLGSWWEALDSSDAPFDLVLSNPPYLAANDPHLSDPALQHEPPAALVSGPLGLESLAHIAAHAAAHLRPGGWLLLEHGAAQGAAVRQLLAQAGFEGILTRQDLAGLDRVTEGRRTQV